MFRGEKGGAHPNKYGWTWTEIVGDNGTYPLAMNEEVADLNEQYRVDYGCGEYGTPAMSGSGLLESTATPYVYKGKMYIGSFDNATAIQSQTVIKVLTKLQYMMKAKETGNRGPTLTQLFAPIYEVLAHPQHVWVMDENERITPVESANALLDGTTNDYVWRFIEYNGKLYTGTFDSSTSYNYFLGYIKNTFLTAVKKNLDEMPEYVQQLMNGSFSDTLKALLRKAGNKSGLMGSSSGTIDAESANAAIAASSSAEAFLDGDDNEERLLYNLEELKDAWEETTNRITSKPRMSMASANGTQEDAESLNKAGDMIEWLLEFFEGLEYLVKARKLVAQAESGFDIFVTEDGEIWEKVVGDGLSDIYNYGARTFTILNDELYVGTANPYYGAQLWKVSGEGSRAEPVVTREPAAANSLKYNGKKQKLVTEGAVQGGTIRYALQENGKTSAWSETVPTAVNAGTYKVLWDVAGDRTHKDAPGGTITVSIGKAAATITVKTASKTYKASSVRKKARSFKIGASASSKAKLSYKVVKYKNKASKKYLRFLTKSGKVKVKKGTPRGTYKVKVKITAPATANYMKKEITKTLTVKVK